MASFCTPASPSFLPFSLALTQVSTGVSLPQVFRSDMHSSSATLLPDFLFLELTPARRRRRLRADEKEQTGKERGCEECKIPALARSIGVWYGETPSFDNSREQSHDGHPAEYEQDLQKGLPGTTKKQKQTLTRAMHSMGDIKGKLHTKHLVLFSLQRHQCDDSYQTQQLKKGLCGGFHSSQ